MTNDDQEIGLPSGEKPVETTKSTTKNAPNMDKNGEEQSKTDASVVEDGTEEQNENSSERERYSSSWAFVLTCIGFAVGLGNIWRFPSLAYENGGGAFLIPYICFSVLFGLPMLYLEFACGQYMQSGPSTLFYKYMPALQGIGWVMAALAMELIIYYYVIVGWALVYLFDVVTGNMNIWTRCDNEWNSLHCKSEFNSDDCKEKNASLPYYHNKQCHPGSYEEIVKGMNITTALVPAEEYFENVVLQRSSGIDDFGGMNWKICITMFFLWVLCAIILWKGVKFIGRLSYFTTVVPYVIVAILFVRGVTLDGSRRGMDYYILKPDLTKIYEFATWKNALTQMCYSLSIGFGGLQSMASYNVRSHNCFRDAVIVVAADCFMSIFGGIAVFSVLGYLSTQTNTPMDKVVQSGTSLAFVAYPEAMAKMTWPWLWAFLFFFMLALLGISTVVVHVQTVVTCLSDYFPTLKKHKNKLGFAICATCFILGLVMCTNSGIYWFTIFDDCTGGFAMCFVIMMEAILIAYCYGVKNFMADLESLFGPSTTKIGAIMGKLGWYYRINWWTISPLLAAGMMIITAMRGEMQYGKGERAYKYPFWAELFGWILTSAVLVFIPLFFIINLRAMKREEGNYMAVFRVHRTHPSYKRLMGEETTDEEEEEQEKNSRVPPSGKETMDNTNSAESQRF